MQYTTKNRWLMALAAVSIHLCIGSVYAWSVYVNPITLQTGWSLTDVTTTFSIAIFFLGLSAALLGKYVESKGARFAATLSAALFGVGTVGSGIAVAMESTYLLYLTYGVIGGIGLGIGYIAPVSTLIKWFPDRRGLATGLAIMGFGFASAVSGPAIKILIDKVGIPSTFYLLGTLYFTVMISAARYLETPPKTFKPKGFKPEKVKPDLFSSTRNEAVKTGYFYGLWLMLFINVTCGIAIISVASPMLQEVVGISAMAAASAVGLMGIFNGAGRIVWAGISDHLTRPVVFVLFFATQIVAFYLLTETKNIWLYSLLVYYIMTCYGGAFASIPAYIGDIFGTKELGAIHGYVLTAWALAGLVGPMLIAYIKDLTGNYTTTLYLFIIALSVALGIALMMLVNIRKAHIRRMQNEHDFTTSR